MSKDLNNSNYVNSSNATTPEVIPIKAKVQLNGSEIKNQTIDSRELQIPAYLQYSNDMDYYEAKDMSSSKHIDLLTRTRVHDKILNDPYDYSPNDQRGLESEIQPNNTYFNVNSLPLVTHSDQEFFGNFEPDNDATESENSPLYGISEISSLSYLSPAVKSNPLNTICFIEISVCEQNLDAGTCFLAVSRYYFNYITRDCIIFNYTGCGGNLNNFLTIAECQTVCIQGSDFC
ncbi:hypothetical protein MXB_4003 [Myxobolus squamalis]|nr:hypothetical protein MXB_4003 [Myxobolus squamalis]